MKKLTIKGKVFLCLIGRDYVSIRTEDNRRLIVAPCWEVKNISVDAWEKGKYKHTSDGQVTPRELSHYIRVVLGMGDPEEVNAEKARIYKRN